MSGHSMSKRSSRKSFRKGAVRVHPANFAPAPMRGGYRF